MISYMWTNQNRLFAVFTNLAHKKNIYNWNSPNFVSKNVYSQFLEYKALHSTAGLGNGR